MRFSLYGQGEGVYKTTPEPFWAYSENHIIVDASLSARAKGIKPGLPVKAAQALFPNVQLYTAESATNAAGVECDRLSGFYLEAMKNVYETLWQRTPWVETVAQNAFFALIPGKHPPLREVRDWLLAVDGVLQKEQRVRVALAETPDRARALLAWSMLEGVPGATYRKAGRQHVILSPALTSGRDKDMNWFLQLPIQTMWQIPTAAKNRLQTLGVYRLGELLKQSDGELLRQFGREALLWRFAFAIDHSEHVKIKTNYPPVHYIQTWTPEIGVQVQRAQYPEIIRPLIHTLSAQLKQTNTGGLCIGISCASATKTVQYQRVAKHPAYQVETLWSRIAPGLEDLPDEMEQVSVYVTDIRPLIGVQTALLIHHGHLLTNAAPAKDDILRLLSHINRRFPKRLQIGLQASFRERRLAAMLKG